MTENKKFCPNCGTAHTLTANACRNCGERLSSSGTNVFEKPAAVLGKVSSTVSKVESTMNTAATIGSAADRFSQIIVRPPAEWKVVVGEMVPQLANEAVDKVVTTAVSQAQGKVQERVQQEITSRVGDVDQNTYPDSATPPPAPPGQSCQSCGFRSPPGNKFCGSCGVALGGQPVQAFAPASLACSSCGTPVVPGKKFCGKCGTPVIYSMQQPQFQGGNNCPQCGTPVVPGKKFCGKCGGRVS